MNLCLIPMPGIWMDEKPLKVLSNVCSDMTEMLLKGLLNHKHHGLFGRHHYT